MLIGQGEKDAFKDFRAPCCGFFMFLMSEIRMRTAAIVAAGMIVCILGLTQCAHPLPKDTVASIYSPRMGWMFDDELMQKVERVEQGGKVGLVDAELFSEDDGQDRGRSSCVSVGWI